MTDRIGVAAICLHISSAIYLIAGLAFMGYFLPSAQSTRLPSGVGWVGGALCLAFAAGIELVAWGLRRRRYWGWVAGVYILTLYIPTVFLPLGAVGLWALLTPATRELFGVAPLTSVSRRQRSSSMASVVFPLLLLAIALIAVAIACVRISGVGIRRIMRCQSRLNLRVHRLVGLALFAVAALSAAFFASAFVLLILGRYRSRAS
jgi:hypothetical protein